MIYVGKAKSIRKRVASHFSNPRHARRTPTCRRRSTRSSTLVTATEAEALLAEQKLHQAATGRASTSACATTSPIPTSGSRSTRTFPRVYFTRERHRRERAYFGPYSNAKRVRETLDLLGKIFLFRSCDGAEPGRRRGSPVPRLLHQALRGALRRLRLAGGVPARRSTASSTSSPAATARSSASSRQRMHEAADDAGVRAGRARAQPPAGGALAARAPARRERVGRARSTRSRSRSTGRDANAQVFQVRDGVLSDRQSFYLDNEAERERRRGRRGVHRSSTTERAWRSRRRSSSSAAVGARRRAGARRSRERRGGAGRAARGRARRQAPHPRAGRAQRASSRSTRSGCSDERRRQQPGRGARRPAARRSGSTRCRCGSSASTSPTSAARTRSPRWSCSRAARRRSPTTAASRIRALVEGVPDDFAAMEEVLAPPARAVRAPARPLAARPRRTTRASPRCPNVVVIDGGKGQLVRRAARRCEGFRERGVAIVSLAKRIEEVFVPRPRRAARARPRHARAAAAPARARRGAPLRDRRTTASAATGR